MKPFIVFAALVAASQASSLEGVSDSLLQSVIRAKWSSFKSQHGKQYSAGEESLRMQKYLEASKMIEEHNARFHAGLESFEMGHNELSDLSLHEVASTKMGLRVPSDAESLKANATFHVPSGYQAPESIDWRAWGGVQSVKNQGSCGSCYAFSAMGALETAYWRKRQSLPNLSEQHCVDCTREYGNLGCQGGWMHDVFRWIKDKQGVASQRDYPYTASVGNCRHSQVAKAAHVSAYTMVRNENDLLNAVGSVGTVSIAYNANTNQHSYYKGGVLDIPNCGNTPTHAVLLVGYGRENGKDYWLLKNSWGTSWGEQGYFKLRRGSNMCGIADWASYPTAA